MKTRRQAGFLIAVTASLSMLGATAAASASRTLFFDDFNRSGSLSTGDWVPRGNPAVIEAGRACGDTQSSGFYGAGLSSRRVRISYSFSSAGVEGFETYVAFGTGAQMFIAGCDGGYGGGLCTPVIRHTLEDGGENGGPRVNGQAISMSTDTTYRVEAELNDGVITLAIADSSGTVLGSLGLSVEERFKELGVAVGRKADGLLSCIDDFRLEDLGTRSASTH